jgi:4-hydroxy-2-oxoheptanedioate aldolase
MSMVQCFQALNRLPATLMARVPWNEPGIIGKALDAGAYGIICPMVNTPEAAAAQVAACRYPPLGERSNGPIRAAAYGAAGDYQLTANDDVLVIPMIETRRAVADIEAILDVPGIDAIYVGPSDLAFTHGLTPELDTEEPLLLGIYERLLEACGQRGIQAGIHCASPPYAARMIAMGFRLVTIASDSGLLGKAAGEAVAGVWRDAGGFR